MRLAFVVEPVDDLEAAVVRWESAGLAELWRPDAETVVLGRDGRASIMVENHPVEHVLGPGPVFVVDSVIRVRALRPDVSWLVEPCEVPGGRYAAYRIDDGIVVRVLDLTGTEPERALFDAEGSAG